MTVLVRGTSFFGAATCFVVWTALSFFAHNFARHVINGVNKQPGSTAGTENQQPVGPDVMWFCILVLTLFQIGIGAVILLLSKRIYQFFGVGRIVYRSGPRPSSPEPRHHLLNANANGNGYAVNMAPNQTESESEALPAMSVQLQLTLALSHLIATAATNASIAFATPAPAFVIKAFEPITTAILAALVGGKRVETHVIVSLPLVAIGAVGFTWRSDFQLSNFFGISMAVVSNIMYGLRNIGVKSILHDSSGRNISTFAHLHILAHMSIFSGTILAWLIFMQTFSSPGLLSHYVASDVVIEGVLSGFFHVSYTVVSVVVMLTVLSVVAHATANLGKRVIISLLFYIIGWQPPTLSNALFGLVFLVGLIIYSNSKNLKFSETQESQSLILSIIFTTFVLAFAFFPASFVATTSKATLKTVESHRPVPLPAVSMAPQAFRYRRDFFIKKENKINFVKVEESNIDTLYPNYQTVLSSEEEDFLNVDLFENPDRADWLSKRLPIAHDVVMEAQRIHYHLFSRLVKGYKRAVLVNVFTWANRGDHLITIGERVILARFNLTLDYYCYYPGDDCDFKGISRSKDLVVFIQGAGYIGHEAHVPVVKKTIKAFPNNRVIFFPISVCCTSKEEIAAYQDIFVTHNDLSLLLRDRFSYEISKKSFTKTKCYLSPDSAFAVGPQRLTIVPTHDVIWVKRDDWENYRDKNHDQLPTLPKNMTALIQDWDEHFMDQQTPEFMEDHQLKSMSALIYLARGKVVITDRLHAHLMSTLLGKANIVVNSITRKQQNYYDTWEHSIKTSACVDSATEALKLAANFINQLHL